MPLREPTGAHTKVRNSIDRVTAVPRCIRRTPKATDQPQINVVRVLGHPPHYSFPLLPWPPLPPSLCLPSSPRTKHPKKVPNLSRRNPSLNYIHSRWACTRHVLTMLSFLLLGRSHNDNDHRSDEPTAPPMCPLFSGAPPTFLMCPLFSDVPTIFVDVPNKFPGVPTNFGGCAH